MQSNSDHHQENLGLTKHLYSAVATWGEIWRFGETQVGMIHNANHQGELELPPSPRSSALRILLRSLHVLFNFATGSCLFPVRLPTLNRGSGSHVGHTCIAQTAGASAPRPAQNPLPAPVDEPHLPDPLDTTAEPPALQLLPKSAPPSCPQLLPTWSRTSDVAADWP